MKYNALVIGLGKIGLGFDLNSKPGHILTHTKAYLKNRKFNLVAGVDIDSVRRKLFKKFSKREAYKSIDEFRRFSKKKIDIVSLCTPESVRLSEMRNIVKLNPRLVVIEKPIAMTINETMQIRDLAKKEKIKIFVNYIRRVDPFFAGLKKIIDSRQFGRVLLVNINYSGGLYKNASHFIDLMLYYFGMPLKVLCLSRRKKANNDVDASFILSYLNFGIHFQDISDQNYSVGEIDLFFEYGRIMVLDFGANARIFKLQKDSLFKGFNALKQVRLKVKPQLDRYQDDVVKHLLKVLQNEENPVSDAKSATETLIICKKIENGQLIR